MALGDFRGAGNIGGDATGSFGFGGGDFGGGGGSFLSDRAEALAKIRVADIAGDDQINAARTTATAKTIGKGLLASLLSAITGGLIGAGKAGVGSALNYTDKQKEQFAQELKDMNPSLTDEQAKIAAENLPDQLISRVKDATQGMTGQERANYVSSHEDELLGSDWVSQYSEQIGQPIPNIGLGDIGTGGQLPGGATDGFIPSTIPANLAPGYQDFVTGSQGVTDQYTSRADQLWQDYLDFEQQSTQGFGDIRSQYDQDLAGIPGLTLNIPEGFGSGSIPLAPKVHSQMFGQQAGVRSGLQGQINQGQLAGIGSRDALAKNIYGVGSQNLLNQRLPTDVAMDLFNLDKRASLGIQMANAEADANAPSPWSTWAPVVGQVLQSGIIDDVWDYFNQEEV